MPYPRGSAAAGRAAGNRRGHPWTTGRRTGVPTRHYGSVDVFLEAFSGAAHGDVLVVDNGGREDEACIGDLVVLEAQAAGVGGVMVWHFIAIRRN